MITLAPCNQEQYWLHCPDREPFSKTFDSKAKLIGKWDKVKGAWDEEGHLLGCSLTTVSSQGWGNLQLLHVFSTHQGKGVGRVLLSDSIQTALQGGATYWRVSSEKKAVDFYKKCGIQFAGKQKSGCLLCVAKLSPEGELIYDWEDSKILSAVYKKGKGGCVEVFF